MGRVMTEPVEAELTQEAMYADYLEWQHHQAHLINLEYVDRDDIEHDGFQHPELYTPPF